MRAKREGTMMHIERTSMDGLTHETWWFDLHLAHVDGPPVWMCSQYTRETRKRKTAKTWARTAYYGTYPEYYAGRNTTVLQEAPIDQALADEVHAKAAAAPVVGKR